MAGHHVGVALHDDRLPALRDLALGQVRPVQHGALAEQRGLRRVEVLGPVVLLVELAGAERDDVAGQVADGPHQPAAEPVTRPAVALDGQARADQVGVGEAASAQVPGQVFPRLRRVPDAEPLGIGELETAIGQEGTSVRGIGSAQSFGIKLGGGPVRVDQPAPLALFLPRDVAALLVAQLDAGPAGQPLDRLDEAESVDLLHELDRVATLGTRKTVEKSSCWGDVERGCFLLVERA